MSDNDRPHAGEYRFLAQATLHRMWPKDRRRLHALAIKHTNRRTVYFSITVGLAFYFTCLFNPGQLLFANQGMPGWIVESFDGILVGMLVAVYVYLSNQRDKIIRSFLRRKLHQRGIRTHFCLKCDYNLRGIESNACPECGALLAPLETQEQLEDEDFAPADGQN